MGYKVFKTLTGKVQVKYECPHCGESLRSEITESGHDDSCPQCQKTFVVPGETERKQLEEKLRQDAENRKRNEEAKREQERLREIEKEKTLKLREIEKEKAIKLEGEIVAEQQRHDAKRRAEALEARPFIYRVVHFEPENPIAQRFQNLINLEAEQGWEFYQFEIINTIDPPGCLAALLGNTGTLRSNHLAIFRRPS